MIIVVNLLDLFQKIVVKMHVVQLKFPWLVLKHVDVVAKMMHFSGLNPIKGQRGTADGLGRVQRNAKVATAGKNSTASNFMIAVLYHVVSVSIQWKLNQHVLITRILKQSTTGKLSNVGKLDSGKKFVRMLVSGPILTSNAHFLVEAAVLIQEFFLSILAMVI